MTTLGSMPFLQCRDSKGMLLKQLVLAPFSGVDLGEPSKSNFGAYAGTGPTELNQNTTCKSAPVYI